MVDDLVWIRRLAANGNARAIRLASGLTLAEVAAEVGASVSAVSRWETGNRRPRTPLARRWASLMRRLAA